MANVGDTRAVLCQDSICERLSFDHKANCPEEIERVKYLTLYAIIDLIYMNNTKIEEQEEMSSWGGWREF